jgi:hypothetical protein
MVLMNEFQLALQLRTTAALCPAHRRIWCVVADHPSVLGEMPFPFQPERATRLQGGTEGSNPFSSASESVPGKKTPHFRGGLRDLNYLRDIPIGTGGRHQSE